MYLIFHCRGRRRGLESQEPGDQKAIKALSHAEDCSHDSSGAVIRPINTATVLKVEAVVDMADP